MTIHGLAQRRAAKLHGQRFGPRYNFGATYLDAADEAVRRGDRVIGTEHIVLALLADPRSPAAQAIGCDLASARDALDALDDQALDAIGVRACLSAGPITVRPRGSLRLTPAAKAIFTAIPGVSKDRRDGLGIVVAALLARRRPDPAADLLDALDVDRAGVAARFAELDKEMQS